MKNFFTREKALSFLSAIKSKKGIFAFLLLIVVVFLLIKNNKNEDLTIVNPIFGDLEETVKATGQVISETDLDLSFDKQAKVRSVNVKVGDRVNKGQTLVTLESGNELAKITEAKALLAGAEAKLAKVKEGSSNEEINLARVLLNNAERDYENDKMTQETLVNNAYKNLLNSTPEAVPSNLNSIITAPEISGNFNLKKEGVILITIFNTGNGLRFSASGLASGDGLVSTNTPQIIGESGLYILFSSTSNIAGTEWKIEIPNKKASDYITNKNAYESALKTKDSVLSSALSLVEQRKAELALKEAGARNSEILLAEADVLSARARLEEAEVNYGKNILRAPSSGVITKVDIKVGELAQPQESIIIIQDTANLYVESDINESNIAKLDTGQKVEITFDALPKEEVFLGEVASVNPSADTLDGIVNYKVKILLDKKDKRIKPGMNSELSILISEKKDVLSLPEAGIIKKTEGNFVRLVVDEEKKEYQEVSVELGQKGDGNMIEIISGISKEVKIAIPVEE